MTAACTKDTTERAHLPRKKALSASSNEAVSRLSGGRIGGAPASSEPLSPLARCIIEELIEVSAAVAQLARRADLHEEADRIIAAAIRTQQAVEAAP